MAWRRAVVFAVAASFVVATAAGCTDSGDSLRAVATTTTIDPVDAHCDAEASFLRTERAAFEAWEAGDVEAADRAIRTEVAAAFATWRDTLGPAGLAEDVAPLVESIERWFDAAEDGGIEAYDAASGEISDGTAAATAYDKHFDWVALHC